MAELAFKQMIATFIRQTRPQKFSHGKPLRYPQRSVTTVATTKPEVVDARTRPAWQAHSLATADTEDDLARKPRLEKLRTESDPRPFSSFLTDSHSREHNYLRISLTERCNLRCLYCMPEEGVQLSPPDHILTTPEIIYLSSLFVNQGVDKIRLTGGEPTVRKDILDLMRQIGQLRTNGLKELCITTNGISLHRKLDSMLESGLTGVNLSLDTLDPFQFTIMTRRNGHEAVMKSINQILEMNKLGAGIKLKINCVVMRGLNDKEILPFVELGRENDLEVRFIEYMPFDGNKWSQNKMMSYKEMLALIRQQYPTVHKADGHANDTSKTYKIPGFAGRIGFITSMTDNFCGTCNRLRITSDGNLKVCLFGNSEVSLRDILRESNDGKPLDVEAMEALKQVESDRRQALQGSTGALGVSEREARLLDVIGAAVKRKKAKHADNILYAQTNNTTCQVQPSLRTESSLLPIRSSPVFSRSVPVHLLSRSSRSFVSQQQRYRSTLLLRRTYITRKSVVRRVLLVPTHRKVTVNPTQEPLAKQTGTQQEPVKEKQNWLARGGEQFRRQSHHRSTSSRSVAGERQSTEQSPLSHLTASGEAHMVSISHKKETARSATAVCHLIFSSAATYPALSRARLKKGDAVAVARIAGIQAAKKTADLIPLAHPGLSITGVTVDIVPFAPDSKKLAVQSRAREKDQVKPGFPDTDPTDAGTTHQSTDDNKSAMKTRHGGVRVTATVECYGKTGVEMEALTAANVATLTMYDMLKGIDKTMCITASRVTEKRGGKSGSWRWNQAERRVEVLDDTNIVVGPTQESAAADGHEVRTTSELHASASVEESPPPETTSFQTESVPTEELFASTTATNENDAQSVLEAEWKSLTTSFSSPDTDKDKDTAATPTDPPSEPSNSNPVNTKPTLHSDETNESSNNPGFDPNESDPQNPLTAQQQQQRNHNKFRWPVSRSDISGDAFQRIDSADFRNARFERYELWKSRH